MARKYKEHRLIEGMLARVRRGYALEVGVLADYLEENSHPHAKKVRRAYDKWCSTMTWIGAADFSRRRRWTRWEAAAAWHQWLIGKIATIFGRKWQRLPRRLLHQRNRGAYRSPSLACDAVPENIGDNND